MANPLRDYLVQKAMTATEFCRASDFPKGLVSQWLNGKRTPSYFSMRQIEEATHGKVPVAAWPAKPRKRPRRRAA